MMKPIAALLLVSTFVVAGAGEPGPDAKDKKARKPNFTISKETTYVTGPVDKDGYIDYAAALNERLSKGVTADNNANVLIWKALGPRLEGGKGIPAEFFKLMGMEEPPETGEYFIDLRRFLREQLNVDPVTAKEIDAQLLMANRYPWTAKDHPQVAEWLKANEKPLALVIEATKRPRYFAPLARSGDPTESVVVLSMMSGVGNARILAVALAARAMLRAGEAKSREAWEDLLACQRLGRHVASGWSNVESLPGFACEQIGQRAAIALLDRPDVDGRLLAAISRDLQSLPSTPSFAVKLGLGERLSFLDTAQFSFRRSIASLPGSDPGELDLDTSFRRINQFFDQILPVVREQDRVKREKELNRIEADLERLVPSGKGALDADAGPKATSKTLADIWIKLAIPGIRKTLETSERSEQGNGNLHVAVALAAYQRDQGSYPKTLDALTPKYLAKIPDDLFTGKPLIYRPSENGYLLYSFGPDGKDGEGRGVYDDPKGDDIAVRIPVPRPTKK